MRENFKLRKKKVGLVSVAIAAMYMTMQGQAEASENTAEVPQPTSIQNIEDKQVEPKRQLVTESPTNPVVEPTEAVEAKQTDTKENVQENYVKLDKVTPGDTKITGKTLPNQIVSLTIDGKSLGSVEGGDGGFAESDDNGAFTFDLNDRNIVFNQKVDVISSNLNFDIESEEGSEESMLEEEGAEATDTTTTGRYDKAYAIPTKQLEKQNGHHQVLVEPILKDSGIIKGHTSVKGRVALAINNKFINLGYDDFDKNTPLAQAKARNEGIWKFIDDKGYFEFDFKRTPFESHQINKDDLISITFKPDDEEEALIPLIFNLKASDFANVATATTSYSPNDVKKVATLNNGAADLEVEDIHGFVYESDRGIDKPVDSSQGTREIKGKTKFANAVVNINSSLGEGNEFPDLQVNEKGEFSFNASEVGIRLNNGEKLHFTVVDPLTGAILSNLVTKEITVAETEEEKKERTLNELLDITPAYYRLVGDEIRGYDIHGNVLDYFNANDKEEIARHFKSLGIDQPNFKLLPGWPTETKSATMTDSKSALSVASNTTAMPKVSVQAPSEVKSVTSPEASLETRSKTTPKTKTEPTTIAKSASRPNTASQLSTTAETTPASQTIPVTTLGVASTNQTMMQSSSAPTPVSTNVVSHAKTTQAKALPETGHEKTHAGLLGTFLLGLGALFLLGRKRKSN